MKLINILFYIIFFISIIIYAYPVDNSNIYAADIIATTNNACLNKDNDNDKNNNPCPTTTTKPSSPSSTSTIQPTSTDDSPSPYPVYGNDSTVTVQMGVLGGLFIVLGLYLMALGFRGFRITMLIMGFLLFGLLTWIALTNCQPSEGYINDHITMIVVPAGLGILGGILFVIFWNIGIYLVGAIGGLGLGLFILCWKQDLVITSIIARPCFLVGMSIVVGAATFFVETYVILFSTSFIGAFIFIIGVDVLARTGYVAGIRSILDRNPLHVVFYSLSRNVYILLAFTIVLFLIAFGWQFLYNRGRQYFGMVYTTEKIKSMAEPSPPIAEEKKEDKPASPPPQQKEEATTAEPSEAAKPKDNPT